MPRISDDITESFLSEGRELCENIKKNIIAHKNAPESRPVLQELLRSLHTLKGNSRMLGYTNIEHLSHAVEDIYKCIKENQLKVSDRLIRLVFLVIDKISEVINNIASKGTEGSGVEVYLTYCDKLIAGEIFDIDEVNSEIQKSRLDSILNSEEESEEDKNVAQVQSIRIKLDKINDIISSFDDMIIREFRLKHQLDSLREIEESTGNHMISRLRKQFENDIAALETTIFSVQQLVFNLRMLPLSMVLTPLTSTIAIESIQLGKKVSADIPDTEISLDKIVLEQLSDVLMHLVRNALDHGLETPEERKAQGKSEEGRITIKCKGESKYIELTIQDDGRGIDYEKVREKAIKLYPERGDEVKTMTEKELNSFLFMSGFSTKDNVTEISGRGVGLDVVWTNIEKIKGRITIESKKGVGTSFILRFPLSLATLQGLFVTSNKDKYLIPSQHIVDIIYRKKSEYINLQNQNYIKLEDVLIPVYSLSSLFKNQKVIDSSEADSILIAEYMEQQVGIIVENVQRYASLVVKPLPAAFKNFTILQGIVFDEHYDIVPILNIADIIKKFRSLRGYDIKRYEANTKARTYRILVVDDSETTLHIERTILSGGGYQVESAKDGIDAIEKIKSKQFDLIVSDKDMPRMNGMVLLENIRLMENYKTVPFVVISADQNPDVYNRFMSNGASAFIPKGDFKRGTLLNKVKELLNE